MKNRFSFIFAALFAATIVAGIGKYMHYGEEACGRETRISISYEFRQNDSHCRGELEMPLGGGGAGALFNKDFQRRDSKTNLKFSSQSGSEAPHNALGHLGGFDGLIHFLPNAVYFSGIQLLHYLGRLNI